MDEDALKNGLIGELAGYRIHGKTYDAEGNEIQDVHDADCFCCRPILIKGDDEVINT